MRPRFHTPARRQKVVRLWALALWISLGFHSLLFFVVLRPATLPPEAEVPAPVEMLPEASFPQSTPPVKKAAGRTAQGSHRNAAGGFASGGPSMSHLLPREGEGAFGSPRGDAAGRHGPAMDSVGALEDSAPLIPFFEALWQRIDGAVEYPPEFVNRDIQGQVQVRLVVDKHGRLRNDPIRIDADHDFLRAYVLATVVQALNQDLPERLWQEKRPVRLHLQFEFETYTDTISRERDRGHAVSNAMRFHRRAYREAKFNKALRQLRDGFLPPVIFLPAGGFMVDFVRVYHMVDDFVHPKPDENVMEEARLQLFRQKLDLVVRESEAQRGR